MRALLLAWRARGAMRIHSSSFSSVVCALLRRSFFFAGQARLLLLEPRRVVAFEGDALATVELQDPAGDVVEKVAVMSDGDDGPRVALQVLLEPLHGLGVEMVRGLIEQQDVGLSNEKTAKRDTAALASGEQVDFRIGRRAPERVHRDLELRLDLPPIGGLDLFLELALTLEERVHLCRGHLLGKSLVDFLVLFEKAEDLLSPFLNDFFDGFAGSELRLLLEITDAIAFGEAHPRRYSLCRLRR